MSEGLGCDEGQWRLSAESKLWLRGSAEAQVGHIWWGDVKGQAWGHHPQRPWVFQCWTSTVSFSKPAFLARGQGLSQGMGTQWESLRPAARTPCELRFLPARSDNWYLQWWPRVLQAPIIKHSITLRGVPTWFYSNSLEIGHLCYQW